MVASDSCWMRLLLELPMYSRLAAMVHPRPAASQVAAQDGLNDFRVLAAGLERLLTRYTKRTVARDFQASTKASKALGVQLTLRSPTVTLPAGLLNDVGHEIAQFADETTRAAARRCLQRMVEQRRALAPNLAGRTRQLGLQEQP